MTTSIPNHHDLSVPLSPALADAAKCVVDDGAAQPLTLDVPCTQSLAVRAGGRQERCSEGSWRSSRG
jgi:hypothetical protein